jgi:HSP20 family molecular chaperone IbpA
MAEQKADGAIAPAESSPARRPQYPLSVVERMEQQLEGMRRRMLEGFGWPFAHPAARAPLAEIAWAPTVDAYEKDGTFVIKAELPGVNQGDISITLEHGYLTIAARREEEQEAKDARYYTAERFSGSLRRSFALPDGVEASAITARFKDGVLVVRVPLPKQPAATATQIPIKG